MGRTSAQRMEALRKRRWHLGLIEITIWLPADRRVVRQFRGDAKTLVDRHLGALEAGGREASGPDARESEAK